jgi:hypothetical protein
LAIVLDYDLDGSDWQHELRLGCWVLVLVQLVEAGEREVQVVAGVRPTWVSVSSQHEGLGHVTEGGFWCLRLDFTTFAVVALPHPSSETGKQLLLDRLGGIEQVWGASCVGTKLKPVAPVGGSKGVIHRCSVNCSPARVDVTSKIVADVGCASVQDSCWGRGKRVLKWVRNE